MTTITPYVKSIKKTVPALNCIPQLTGFKSQTTKDTNRYTSIHPNKGYIKNVKIFFMLF